MERAEESITHKRMIWSEFRMMLLEIKILIV